MSNLNWVRLSDRKPRTNLDYTNGPNDLSVLVALNTGKVCELLYDADKDMWYFQNRLPLTPDQVSQIVFWTRIPEAPKEVQPADRIFSRRTETVLAFKYGEDKIPDWFVKAVAERKIKIDDNHRYFAGTSVLAEGMYVVNFDNEVFTFMSPEVFERDYMEGSKVEAEIHKMLSTKDLDRCLEEFFRTEGLNYYRYLRDNKYFMHRLVEQYDIDAVNKRIEELGYKYDGII